jgi:hypothetical protein
MADVPYFDAVPRRDLPVEQDDITGTLPHIAEELRQAWNARAAADIVTLAGEFTKELGARLDVIQTLTEKLARCHRGDAVEQQELAARIHQEITAARVTLTTLP